MADCQVAILGGGISGCLTACLLSDEGYDVRLVDRNAQLMSAASRWNEGKIHLGFTYTGRASLETARLMIEGAAEFENVIEQVTGVTPPDDWYSTPIVYLVDPHSLFPSETLWGRARAVADLLVEHAATKPGLRRYLDGGPVLQALSETKAATETGLAQFGAAWRTPERAITPGPVAALIRKAVAERGIDVLCDEVRSVQRGDNGWHVQLDSENLTAPVVVNCTWESRAMFDAKVLDRPAPVSIRYKYSLFGTGLRHLTNLTPSTRIIGRFGDVTPYGNGQAYLSWYPAGLAGLADDGSLPKRKPLDPACLIADTLAGLGLDSSILEEPEASWEVRGGYIVAHGYGDIDDVGSPLHERSRPGPYELAPGYLSVDTGKYSLGPFVASRTTDLVRARIAPHSGHLK